MKIGFKSTQNSFMNSNNLLWQYSQKIYNNQTVKNDCPASYNTNKTIWLGLGILATIATIGSLIKYNKNRKIFNCLKTEYRRIVSNYPNDKAYFEKLAQHVNLKKGEEYKLSSIMGPQQLEQLLPKFSPQDFNTGINLSNVKNNTYRINLHNHTTASDGLLSVEQILDKSVEIANKIAASKKDQKPPFTLAITDHDTLDSIQEAAKLIVKNPLKYKNLKVVLGCEFSFAHLDPKDVNIPLNYEIIGYALNPFDIKLNSYLNNLKSARKKVIKEIIKQANNELPQYKFNFDEASLCSRNIAKGITNGYIYDLKNYFTLKAGLTESGIVEEKVSDFIAKYGHTFVTKAAFKSNSDFLQQFAKQKGICSNIQVNPKYIQKFQLLRDKYVQNSAKLKEAGITKTAKDFFGEVVNSNSDGFYGIAHPALISLSKSSDYSQNLQKHCSQNGLDWKQYLFKKFITETIALSNGKLKAAETNYQSYSNLYQGFYDYINYVNKTINDNLPIKILPTGGIDCHGLTLFTKK